jgi:hypothetical protein
MMDGPDDFGLKTDCTIDLARAHPYGPVCRGDLL